MTVAVCIPTIPPRREMLNRALASVTRQTRTVDELHVAVDHTHAGAPWTRNRAWHAASTEWVAFLDDDDEFGAEHIETCLAHAELTGADLVYPGYTVVGGQDPLNHFGEPWDPAHPVQTTIVTLVRRSLLDVLGGFRMVPPDRRDEHGNRYGEDYDLVVRANDAGAQIAHVPVRTWTWHHHGGGSPGTPGNTSGLGSNW